jgi:multiple sugar transport system substrate-binding protein
MSRINTALASLAIASALCSGVQVAGAKTEYQKKLEGTELNVLSVAMPQFQGLWQQIPEFEKEYGIKIKLDESPFEQMREKTLVDFRQGTGRYDVISVDVMWLAEYAAAGYLEPVMKYVKNPNLTESDFDIDDILPRVLSGTGVYEDVLYNIPTDSGPIGMTFRRDLMEQAGIKVPERFDGTWTADYFLDTVKKLHHPEKGVVGYAGLPARWYWGIAFTPFIYAWQQPNTVGDEFVDRNWKVTINNQNTTDAMKFYNELKQYGPANSGNYGVAEALALYRQGGAAGTWNYQSWIAENFEDPSLKAIAGKNVYLHTPVGPHGVIDPWFGSWGLSISAASKKKEAAWVFIQWITAKKQELVAIQHQGSPTRHSVYKSELLAKVQPWQLPVYDFMLHKTDPDERIRIPEWAEMSDVMGLEGNKSYIGEISAEEAVTTMAANMTNVIRKGGYYNPSFKRPPQRWRDLTYYDRLPSQWK